MLSILINWQPDVLYSKVVEVDERVAIQYGTTSEASAEAIETGLLVKGLSGDVIRVLKTLGQHFPLTSAF
jgi:exosome complex RNA-binding protein Rrp4